MRNRAKCKKCGDIIESKHRTDFVSCSCEEISIDGGDQYLRSMAKDYNNFLRVDDDGKEIPVKVIDAPPKEDVKPIDMPKPTKEEKLKALESLIQSYESLPANALTQPTTHYDLLSVLLLLRSLSDD